MNFYRQDANGYPLWYNKLPRVHNRIVNFDKLSTTEQKKHGFYPVTCVKPACNDTYQTMSRHPIVTVGIDEVVATWVVVDKPIGKVKQVKIDRLKADTTDFIYSRYPLHKQLNRSIPGHMTQSQITVMDTFISDTIAVYRAARASVHSAKTPQEAAEVLLDLTT